MKIYETLNLKFKIDGFYPEFKENCDSNPDLETREFSHLWNERKTTGKGFVIKTRKRENLQQRKI